MINDPCYLGILSHTCDSWCVYVFHCFPFFDKSKLTECSKNHRNTKSFNKSKWFECSQNQPIFQWDYWIHLALRALRHGHGGLDWSCQWLFPHSSASQGWPQGRSESGPLDVLTCFNTLKTR